MSNTTKNVIVLTDKMIRKLTKEWDNDAESDRLDKKVGRPRISSEDMINITVRMPKSYLIAIEKIVKENGENRSAFLRDAVKKALSCDE